LTAIFDMRHAATRARREANQRKRWRFFLAIGGCGLLAVLLVGVWVSRAADSRPAREPIIYVGRGSQTTQWFHLDGGTYHTLWSAWERAPEYPPCTHSTELIAVDPANGTTSSGHVIDLARFAHVPATGGTYEGYVVNVKPGDYYFDIDSECSWQIAISPN